MVWKAFVLALLPLAASGCLEGGLLGDDRGPVWTHALSVRGVNQMEHACDGVTGLCALVQWSPPVAVCAVQENATYQCAVVVMADLASSTRFMDGRAHASFTDEHGTEASDLVVQRYKPLEWPIDRMLEFWFESPGVVSRDFQADLHVVPTVTLAEDLRPVEVTLDRTVTLTTSRHEGPF